VIIRAFCACAVGDAHARPTAMEKVPENDGCRRGTLTIGRSANYFDLAFTASEFLLDFGQAYGEPGEPVIHTRIIMAPSSAKTLSEMLRQVVEQFEKVIGPKR
jgi:hypothetical protein